MRQSSDRSLRSSEWFDRTSFAFSQDVVLVTINYRLDVFGCLYLADLVSDEVGSGSRGLPVRVEPLASPWPVSAR
jgi:hypothetical protein